MCQMLFVSLVNSVSAIEENRCVCVVFLICLQCFDTVGWAAGRACGL